ncbi:hypothetical protein Lal_00020917 [Lupinus albus]|nr:hypothetical protein Lal_00020917 [Lupinus albus]
MERDSITSLARLEEDEQITIFINTLPNPFFEKMIGNNTSDFNSLIKVGDRIEQSIKAGKIAAEQTMESKKPNYAKKKEAEAHYVYINHNRPPTQHNPTPHYNQPRPNQYPAQQNRPPNNYQTRPYQNFNRNQPRPFQPQRTFDPIPVTYAELFAHLQTERILAPIAGQTPNTTAPWYDPNANCDYHSGIIGHSTETCRALKHRIQDLIDSKWLEFKDTVPTITGNPLPNHGNQGINVLEQDDDMVVVEKVEDMKTPLKVIFKYCASKVWWKRWERVHMKMIPEDPRQNNHEKVCASIEHTRWNPIIYRSAPMGTQFICRAGATRHLGPFPYKSDKAVPWKYQGKLVAKSKQTEEVVNLAGVGNMTRSGRVYSPVDLSRKIINASKGKEKIVETSEDRPELETTELKGFQPGKGLGKYGQGMENTLVLPSNSGRAGLGIKVPIPHISQSFISTCFIKPNTIAMVEDGQLESDLGPVYQCIPGTGLSNWTEEDVASDV